MRKWYWLCLLAVPVILLGGCGGSSTLEPGEGSGTIIESDFDPFGSEQGSMNLRYFTLPESGSYQVILSSGPGQPPLPNPWIRLLGGHVEETNQSFFAAFNNGAGVLAGNWGSSIAQIIITANAGEEFTLVFASKTAGVGTYSWRVVKL